jgi:hypothetical protein
MLPNPTDDRSPLQICENSLYILKEHYKNSRIEREWSALYILFANWHKDLLLLRSSSCMDLSDAIVPPFISLCSAIVRSHGLFSPSIRSCGELRALAELLHEPSVSSRCAEPIPVHFTDMSVCLDGMYDVLSIAIAATERLFEVTLCSHQSPRTTLLRKERRIS